MPNLSIENVPEEAIERLRQQAARNNHSVQDELLDLICRSTDTTIDKISTAEDGVDSSEWLSIGELAAELATSLRRSQRQVAHPRPNLR